MTDGFTPDLSIRLSNELEETDALRARRAEAAERFAALPWPDKSSEQWRHTDLRPLDFSAFSPDVKAPILVETPDENGLWIRPLHIAAAERPDLVASRLEQTVRTPEEEKVRALTEAFGDGLFIHAKAGAHASVVLSQQAVPGAAALTRTIIVAEEASEVTVISRMGGGAGPMLSAPVVEIHAEQGANVTHLVVQDWPQTVWHLGSVIALVGRDATVRSLVATLGGTVSRSVTEAHLVGQGSYAELLGIYFGDGDQHIDNRTLQLYRAPNASSDVYYKGALKGHSSAVYSGLVDIEAEGLQADATQANRNLLLSEFASADANPFLEIKTSEVARATHGVSVGRPNAEALFYLQSRGLAEAEAERLFVTGFFQEVIDRVRVENIREALEAAVEHELALEA